MIVSESKNESDRVVRKLRQSGLQTKDLGFPEYVIGIHVQKRSDGSIDLNQKLYIETILRRFDMQDTHGATTTSDPNVRLISVNLEVATDQERGK